MSNTKHFATAVSILAFGALASAQTATGPAGQVTWTKDVLPIVQKSCQDCHRPGSIAPFSLLTYESARPWARSMKEDVLKKQMPPFYIDRNVGIQHFKNDIGLSDAQIQTIAKWVDGGAVKGDDKDAPAPRQFQDTVPWHIGTPDLVVSLPKDVVLPARSPDTWKDIEVDPHLTEDRWLMAVETKPTKGYRVVHHAATFIIHDDAEEQFTDRGQPTHFYPRRHMFLFKVSIPANWPADKKLTWTLTTHGKTSKAKGWLQPEWEVNNGVITENRSSGTPDLTNELPTITGPGAQTVSLPNTLTLKVSATDDGKPAPKPRKPRGVEAPTAERFDPIGTILSEDMLRGPGLNIKWILYRGPGPVTFSPKMNKPVFEKSVSLETTVSFKVAGNYVLRAIASDGSLEAFHDVAVTVK